MPAPRKHEFTRAEIKAGLMVIVSAVVFALFAAVVSGLRPPAEEHTYYCYFTDIAGLNKGADVRFGGSKVGRVVAIEFDPNDQSRLRVVAAVKASIPVNEDSVATISETSITAGQHLEISTGSKGAPLKKDGDEIPTLEGGGLFGQVEAMSASLDEILADVKALLGVRTFEGDLVTVAALIADVDETVHEATGFVQDTRGIVAESKEDVAAALKKLREVGDAAHKLVTDLDAIVAENRPGVKKSIASLDKALRDVTDLADQVSVRLEAVADALEETLASTTDLTGEVRKLIEDNRSVIDDILLDLRDAIRYLKDFGRTISEQPESLLTGHVPRGRE